MTDISTAAPPAIRRLSLPRLRFPRLGIGAALAAISDLVAEAFGMAYAGPYNGPRRPPAVVPEDDLEGRDPNW